MTREVIEYGDRDERFRMAKTFGLMSRRLVGSMVRSQRITSLG